MHGITLGFQIVALFLIIPMYHTAKPLFHIQPTTDQQLFRRDEATMNGNTVQATNTNFENPHMANGTYANTIRMESSTEVLILVMTLLVLRMRWRTDIFLREVRGGLL